MKGLSALFLFCFLWSLFSSANPARIVLIRHGEKPANGPELNTSGCERAYQLPTFFNQWNDIAAIYAQQPPAAGSSIRSIQTVTPTAQIKNLKINNSFHKDEYQDLVADLLKDRSLDGKTVVVAWEHAVIPKIAEGLGIQLNANLSNWPSVVFDQAWVVTFNEADNSAKLEIIAEHVLPTDIDNSQSGVGNWGAEVPPSDNGIKISKSILAECENGNDTLNQRMNAVVSIPVPH